MVRTHLLRPRIAWLQCAWFIVSLLIVSASAQIPRGVFSLKGAGGNSLPGAYTNPDVAGLSIRQDWAELEPTEGTFAFDYLHQEVKKATDNNKVAFLRIDTQEARPPGSPQAVQDAGSTFFTFDDDGRSKTIPVF